MATPDVSRSESPLATAVAALDRRSVAKTIDAGRWKSVSVETVREVANAALEGTGLAFILPKCHATPVQIADTWVIKAVVEGWLEYGPSAERRQLYAEVIGTPNQRQPVEQLCGSLFSYAAKNCIVGTLNLPRGGDDSAELAHLQYTKKGGN